MENSFIKKALMLGATDYIVKPIDYNVLKYHLDYYKASTNTLNNTNRKLNSIDEFVSNLLISIGIPPQLKGYSYLREAIILTFENKTYKDNITKKLYPKIAEIFETTSSKVERAIRNAIEIAWNTERYENINTIFGYKVYEGKYRPTNAELFALISDRIKLVYAN